MKYIRTKDGIWLFSKTHHNGDAIVGKKQETDFGYCFDKNEIISQADTIEELCDWFLTEMDGFEVCAYPRKFWFDRRYKHDAWKLAVEDYLRHKEDGDNIILLAYVKTGNNLICVAKANDKGELELI